MVGMLRRAVQRRYADPMKPVSPSRGDPSSPMSAARRLQDDDAPGTPRIPRSARLLPQVEKALATQGGPVRPLYAVTIQDALARGDQAEIARIKGEIAAYAQLIANPETAPMPVTPYGVAIQQAKDRGDQAEVERLTKVAEGLLAQLNAGKS